MRVFKPAGSKERLFEMMESVNGIKLNESTLSNLDREKIVNDFIVFVGKKLNIADNLSSLVVTLSYNSDEAKNMKSFGKIIPNDNKIIVIAAKRNLADILRTLAHELVHYKQLLDGRIDLDSGKTGSEIENEANSVAGIIMREFAQINPIIFE